MVLIVIGVMVLIPTEGVREIHNADQLSNFPLVDPQPHDEDWPWWRGTNRRNVAPFTQLPNQWLSSTIEGWIVPLRGRGTATPILWGEQLYLFTSEAESERISLRCHHRNTGREIWRTDIHQGGFPSIHEKNSHASATPACDGQSIYTVAVTHGRLQVSSVDTKGRIAWQNSPGLYWSEKGYVSSPVLFQSLIIVAADQKKDGYLAALHRQTGEIIWRVKRPDGECYGTPVVAVVCGRPQLILSGVDAVTSYDPATGEELWKCRRASARIANSIAFDEAHVFAASGPLPSEVLCIKADGTGDVTHSHLVWSLPNVGGEVPSPVCDAGLLYVLSDDGLLTCIETTAGKIEWRKRLAGSFSASPVVVRNALVCGSDSGIIYLARTGTSDDVIIENSLPDGIVASPIVAGNSIFVRTLRSLYRIDNPASGEIVEQPERLKRRF